MIDLHFQNRYQTNGQNQTLQTNDKGFVYLGQLEDVTYVRSTDRFHLNKQEDFFNYPTNIYSQEGKVISIPWLMPNQKSLTPADASLLSHSQAHLFFQNHFDDLKLGNGFLSMKLPPGNFVLELKRWGVEINIKVEKAEKTFDKWTFSKKNATESSPEPFLNISSLKVDQNQLKLQLENFDESTRVHLLSTYFIPEYDWRVLDTISRPPPKEHTISLPSNQYLGSRTLSDEYLYILERKASAEQQGNTLTRPSLLLNPYVNSKTETSEPSVGGGGTNYAYAQEQASAFPSCSVPSSKKRSKALQQLDLSFNLEFMKESSIFLPNLKPDQNGAIQIDLKKLGNGCHARVIAVNSFDCVGRQISLPHKTIPKNDLRLKSKALKSDFHFTERKQISVHFGQSDSKPFVIDDLSTSSLEIVS